MDDAAAETGHRLMAIRLLVSEDMESVISAMECGQTEEQARRARIRKGIDVVRAYRSNVGYRDAEKYVTACLDAIEPTSLTGILRERLGFAEPSLNDETVKRLWRELGLPGDPGPASDPEPEPKPKPKQPRCGLVELPTPDQAFLAAKALPASRGPEEERQRRERIKHPEQKPRAEMSELDRLIAEAEEEARNADAGGDHDCADTATL